MTTKAMAYQCRNLVENIYSREVLEEYKRRWDAVQGKPWHQGMMSEYFLWRVDSSNKQRSASQAILNIVVAITRPMCGHLLHGSCEFPGRLADPYSRPVK